ASKNITLTTVNESELGRLSTHEAPNQVVAVAYMPATGQNLLAKVGDELVVVCDALNDPGNAGTIIRTADWFGVKNIYFSEGSVDIYNPKVVSAAKGSLFRVNCHYADLKLLFEANKHMKVYGTFMDGDSIYKTELDRYGFILIGNEANGISHELQPFVTNRISIPNFGKAESLNAAVAAGLVLGEFRRKQ
ncbi:MAG TPA: RNA methyltransferase, partial [Chitinophagales bacterium]|nr:RNA methyltransferase [Chitinophagales bacterium]